VILSPDADRSVPATGCEVVTEWTPVDIPDRTLVAFIDHQASPSLKGPEADCLVGGAGDEEFRGGGGGRRVGIVRALDGGRKGDAVDGGRVSDKATRAGWRVILSRSDKRWKRFAM
jgi:hypothetical protein